MMSNRSTANNRITVDSRVMMDNRITYEMLRISNQGKGGHVVKGIYCFEEYKVSANICFNVTSLPI